MPTIDVQTSAGSTSLSYRERGSGWPAVMLVHGAGASSLGFVELLNRVGQQQRAVAVDLPGHGGSSPWPRTAPTERLLERYREAIAALAERIGLGRFVLVGHSMGGAVAQRFACAHGDRLAALVLLATGARLSLGRQLRGLLQRHFEQLPAFLAAHGFSPATPRDAAERWAALSLQAPREVVVNDFAACDLFDGRAALGELELPCRPVVIGGADDQITPPAMSRELATRIPRARLELLSRAGHQLYLERPDATARAILGATA